MGLKMKVCKRCGVKPVLERWSSGGLKYAVRCDNPGRGDGCDWNFYHTISNNPDDAIRKWNEVN